MLCYTILYYGRCADLGFGRGLHKVESRIVELLAECLAEGLALQQSLQAGRARQVTVESAEADLARGKVGSKSVSK